MSPESVGLFRRALAMHTYENDYGFLRRMGESESAQANLTSDMEKVLVSTAPKWLIWHLGSLLPNMSHCGTPNGNIVMVILHGDPNVGGYIFSARGAAFPLILRPTSNDGLYHSIKEALQIPTFYQYVGGAYVHGKMDGEPFRETEAKSGEEETVFLI